MNTKRKYIDDSIDILKFTGRRKLENSFQSTKPTIKFSIGKSEEPKKTFDPSKEKVKQRINAYRLRKQGKAGIKDEVKENELAEVLEEVPSKSSAFVKNLMQKVFSKKMPVASDIKFDKGNIIDKANAGLGPMFLVPVATNVWHCDVCCTENENGKTVCLACDQPRAGVTTNEAKKPLEFKPPVTAEPINTIAQSNALTQGFILPKQDNIWYCSVCNVDNKKEATQCICCETPKPGTENKKDEVKGEITQFGFKPSILLTTKPSISLSTPVSTTNNSNFSFGFKPSQLEPPSEKETSFGFKPSIQLSKTFEIRPSVSLEPKQDLKPDTSTNISLNSTGMFLIPQATNIWHCSVCNAENKDKDSICLCCETARNKEDKKEKKGNEVSGFVNGFGFRPSVQLPKNEVIETQDLKNVSGFKPSVQFFGNEQSGFKFTNSTNEAVQEKKEEQGSSQFKFTFGTSATQSNSQSEVDKKAVVKPDSKEEQESKPIVPKSEKEEKKQENIFSRLGPTTNNDTNAAIKPNGNTENIKDINDNVNIVSNLPSLNDIKIKAEKYKFELNEGNFISSSSFDGILVSSLKVYNF